MLVQVTPFDVVNTDEICHVRQEVQGGAYKTLVYYLNGTQRMVSTDLANFVRVVNDASLGKMGLRLIKTLTGLQDVV